MDEDLSSYLKATGEVYPSSSVIVLFRFCFSQVSRSYYLYIFYLRLTI